MTGAMECIESTLEYVKQEQNTKFEGVVSNIQELIGSVKSVLTQRSSETSDSGADENAQHDSTVVPAPRKYIVAKGQRKSKKLPVRKPHILQLVIKPTRKGMKDMTALALYCNMRNERKVALDNLEARLQATNGNSEREQCKTVMHSNVELDLDEGQSDADSEDIQEFQSQAGDEDLERVQCDVEDECPEEDHGEAYDHESEGEYDVSEDEQTEEGQDEQKDEDDESIPEDEAVSEDDDAHANSAAQDTRASIPEHERKSTILAYEACVLEVVKIDLSTCEAHWAAVHILEEGWNNRSKNMKGGTKTKKRPGKDRVPSEQPQPNDKHAMTSDSLAILPVPRHIEYNLTRLSQHETNIPMSTIC
ncbi:hypothetical protein BJV82DRAFT_652147 [Fennellomyces sp. T-0311]|nr:hypothetical protein BJV82DRAFT_652147 [Fennellomyces sp. T-0311]